MFPKLVSHQTDFLVCDLFDPYFQAEAKRRVESSNRELERNAALFKHDLKEVGVSRDEGLILTALIIKQVFLINATRICNNLYSPNTF